MQSGSGRAASAGPVGMARRIGGIGALLSALVVSACVNSGQIANLAEGGRAAVALESIDGAPAAVVHKFVRMFTEEAGARQIAVVSPSEAAYRLRGYLAAHGEEGAATSIAWALDVYDGNQHRATRLNGEETSAGRMWAAADDQVLHRIARASVERLTAFLAGARPPAAATLASPPPQRASSAVGLPDDWAPEASGIFRIFRREPTRTEVATEAGSPLQPDEVPLPRGRPVRRDARTGAAFAFAPED